MKPSLKDTIKRFKTFSDLANEESTEIIQRVDKDGMGLTYGVQSRKVTMAPHPLKAELIEFLEGLPDHFVFSLVVLMYSGRDRVSDVKDYWLQLKYTITSKDEAIIQLEQKDPRYKFIEKGIQYLGEEQIEEFSEYIQSTLRA